MARRIRSAPQRKRRAPGDARLDRRAAGTGAKSGTAERAESAEKKNLSAFSALFAVSVFFSSWISLWLVVVRHDARDVRERPDVAWPPRALTAGDDDARVGLSPSHPTNRLPRALIGGRRTEQVLTMTRSASRGCASTAPAARSSIPRSQASGPDHPTAKV